MDSLGTGISLETLLQESQQHTVLLSDLRENSEVRRKTDEKTLSQLQKLQQAASQTLKVAQAHKQQSKETSIALKAINEANISSNAIIAKRQTSAINTLSRTLDVGITAVNQKMFNLFEKLGSNIVNAFSAVGKRLENKLYNFLGSFSILVRPIVSTIKLGVTTLTKVLAVPLQMIWTGLKAFSNTLIGKITILGASIYLGYKFLTGTALGKKIATAVWDGLKSFASSHPIATAITGLLSTGLFYAKAIHPIVTAITSVGNIVSKVIAAIASRGVTSTAIKTTTSSAAKIGSTVATSAALSGMSKSQLRKYINANGGNITKNAARGLTSEQLLTRAQSLKPTPAINTASKAGMLNKFGKIGSVLSKGNIAGIIGGTALDYAAENVKNKTASGLLNVGSAALTGAMIGSIIPGIGTAIGASVGGLLGAGASLLAGEGGKKLFGSSDEETEMNTLADLQEQQSKASNAQIHSLEDIAETIRESNKTLTRVVEKLSTDAQHNINRREASTTEQSRHNDAVEQLNMTSNTNELLAHIVDSLQQLTNMMSVKLTQNTQNTTSRQIPGVT